MNVAVQIVPYRLGSGAAWYSAIIQKWRGCAMLLLLMMMMRLCCALPGRGQVLSNRGLADEGGRQLLASGRVEGAGGRGLRWKKWRENAHTRAARTQLLVFARNALAARKHLSQRRLVSIHRAALIRRAALSCAERRYAAGPEVPIQPADLQAIRHSHFLTGEVRLEHLSRGSLLPELQVASSGLQTFCFVSFSYVRSRVTSRSSFHFKCSLFCKYSPWLIRNSVLKQRQLQFFFCFCLYSTGLIILQNVFAWNKIILSRRRLEPYLLFMRC